MPPSDALATGGTAPHQHVESPDERPHHGQIFLILRIPPIVITDSTAS
jgi:hypothetical protein